MSGPAPVGAVLVDLLMATMDSMRVWAVAAGGEEAGMAWRDAVTERMVRHGRYSPYRELVRQAADEQGLDEVAPDRLEEAWLGMLPWPDAAALTTIGVPYAFVTNCSADLADVAAQRAGLKPAFTLSAEEAGWYKPRPEIYRLACQRIGSSPADTLFVAGAAYDADGAARAGLRARLVSRRVATRKPQEVVEVVTTFDAALRHLGEMWPRVAGEC